jgi:hypothetical protein
MTSQHAHSVRKGHPEYLEQLAKDFQADSLPWPGTDGYQFPTRVYYNQREPEGQRHWTPDVLLGLIDYDNEQQRPCICLVENITAPCIAAFGSAFDIGPAFFVGHAKNPNQATIWQPQYEDIGPRDTREANFASRQFYNITGIYKHHGRDISETNRFGYWNGFFPRYRFQEEPWPLQSCTWISYIRINLFFCESATAVSKFVMLRIDV